MLRALKRAQHFSRFPPQGPGGAHGGAMGGPWGAHGGPMGGPWEPMGTHGDPWGPMGPMGPWGPWGPWDPGDLGSVDGTLVILVISYVSWGFQGLVIFWHDLLLAGALYNKNLTMYLRHGSNGSVRFGSVSYWTVPLRFLAL